MTPDLLDGQLYKGDPEPTYQWLRDHGSLYFDEVNKLWAIARHKDVHDAECDPTTFSSKGGSRPNIPAQPSMIDSDNPEHAHRRGLVYRRFTPKAVAEHEPMIRRVASQLVKDAIERQDIDAVPVLAAPLPARVIGALLGFDEDRWPQLVHWSETTIAAGSGPRYLTDDAINAAAEYAGEVLTLAEQKKGCPGQDLISLWANLDEPLPAMELCSEALLLLDGGAETTRTVIANAIDVFAQQPDQWALLKSQPDLIPSAVEELIRWTTPIINMARVATTDVTFAGADIKAGDELMLVYAAANRDERVFQQPQRFDITRSPNPHLSFGIGGHFCLGASLARLELRIMLEEMVNSIESFERADDIGPRRIEGAFVRGIESFPVRVTAR